METPEINPFTRCEWCRSKFRRLRPTQKFCCKACLGRHNLMNWHKKRRDRQQPRPCIYCETVYHPPTEISRFCTISCSRKHYMKNLSEEKREIKRMRAREGHTRRTRNPSYRIMLTLKARQWRHRRQLIDANARWLSEPTEHHKPAKDHPWRKAKLTKKDGIPRKNPLS